MPMGQSWQATGGRKTGSRRRARERRGSHGVTRKISLQKEERITFDAPETRYDLHPSAGDGARKSRLKRPWRRRSGRNRDRRALYEEPREGEPVGGGEEGRGQNLRARRGAPPAGNGPCPSSLDSEVRPLRLAPRRPARAPRSAGTVLGGKAGALLTTVQASHTEGPAG